MDALTKEGAGLRGGFEGPDARARAGRLGVAQGVEAETRADIEHPPGGFGDESDEVGFIFEPGFFSRKTWVEI